MSGLTVFELASMAAGLVGVYVKLHGEVTRLKTRLHQVEAANNEIKQTLKELVTITTEIKLALARNRMDQ